MRDRTYTVVVAAISLAFALWFTAGVSRVTRNAFDNMALADMRGQDRLTIESQGYRIHALGSAAALEEHGAFLLERLAQVDPATLRRGMGLWVAPHGDKPEDLVLIGRITSTEPVTPTGAHSATPGETPKETHQ